ncbi:MAG TPA: hypothetical protein VN200_00690 [Rhodoglobus sp.]|nr:hypothetical protein [Rhodoglobus sp.]
MTTPSGELATPPAGADYPGKTLGLVGLILAIFFNLIGLIVSIVALNQSKAAGYKNPLAKAGVIVGAVLLALGVIIAIISVIVTFSLASSVSTY